MKNKQLISGFAVGAVVGFAVPLCYRVLSERLAKYRRKAARRKAFSSEVQMGALEIARAYFPSLTNYKIEPYYEYRGDDHMNISFESNEPVEVQIRLEPQFLDEVHRRIGAPAEFCIFSIT